MPDYETTTMISLFEDGLSPLEVSQRGHPAKDVVAAYRQWAGKAMAANRRLDQAQGTNLMTDTTPAMDAYKDPWAEVALVEREIRFAAYANAGDRSRSDDTMMFAVWSGRLQKAINDAAR